MIGCSEVCSKCQSNLNNGKAAFIENNGIRFPYPKITDERIIFFLRKMYPLFLLIFRPFFAPDKEN